MHVSSLVTRIPVWVSGWFNSCTVPLTDMIANQIVAPTAEETKLLMELVEWFHFIH